MAQVTIRFHGTDAGRMAKRFFSWLVDGGLEDQMIEVVSDVATTVEITGCDEAGLAVEVGCSPCRPPARPTSSSARPTDGGSGGRTAPSRPGCSRRRK